MARRERDFYETPPDYVRSLYPYLYVGEHETLIDPCAGNLAISRLMEAKFDPSRIGTNDIDPAMPTDLHMDATKDALWERAGDCGGTFDWCVMNPPFSPPLMLPILDKALRYCNNVVTLARLSFLEPTESRRLWWAEHAPDFVMVLPRYSFTGEGNDSVTCCWIGWGPSLPSGLTVETEKPSWRK